MKNIKKFMLSLLWILPVTLLLCACSVNVTPNVVGIEKTESIGSTDTYTITYSNGAKKHFTVENGIDGQDFTIEEITAYCEENDISIEEFFEKYLEIQYSSNPIRSATNIAMKSAVSIFVEHPVLSSNYTKTTGLFCGAGVIYQMDDDYSYIITNYHVLYNESALTSSKIATKITIYQYGQNEKVYTDEETDEYVYTDGAIECEYVGGTDKYDIAIIKAPTSKLLENNPDAKAVTIANGYSLADTVIAVGNPSGYGLSATEGIVSVVNETIDLFYDNGYEYKTHRVLRIDAAVNGGNSGGGLFNSLGELIGIVNAKISSEDVDNMAYAIPFDNATKVADNIIYYHKLTNSTATPKQVIFGLQYYEENFRTEYKKTTDEIKIYNDIVIATEPSATSFAGRLGFKKDDIVKSATIKRGSAETPYVFDRSYNLADLTLVLRSGDSISFVVERAGENVTLGNLETFFVQESDLTECDKTDYIKNYYA